VSSQQSLTWDNFTPPIQQEDDLIFYYETSSTSGLASDTLQERELEQFIGEPERQYIERGPTPSPSTWQPACLSQLSLHSLTHTYTMAPSGRSSKSAASIAEIPDTNTQLELILAKLTALETLPAKWSTL
jgi:hypothetical protein